jgi:hypothetical protein
VRLPVRVGVGCRVSIVRAAGVRICAAVWSYFSETSLLSSVPSILLPSIHVVLLLMRGARERVTYMCASVLCVSVWPVVVSVRARQCRLSCHVFRLCLTCVCLCTVIL